MVGKLLKHNMERSDASHAILDEASRRRKASKIATVVSTYKDISKARVLDIGTGSGHIAEELAKLCKEVVSVDVVDERKVKKGYKFVLAKDEKLPFTAESFDIVISNHVVEHIPNQQGHIQEVFRVVKPAGAVYLATPNKLWLRDPHYKLPFISWLPRWASSKYLRVFTPEAEWDIYPLSHKTLHRWVKSNKGAALYNALPNLVKNPNAKNLDTWDIKTKILSSTPSWFLETSKYWSPTLIYVIALQKKKQSK